MEEWHTFSKVIQCSNLRCLLNKFLHTFCYGLSPRSSQDVKCFHYSEGSSCHFSVSTHTTPPTTLARPWKRSRLSDFYHHLFMNWSDLFFLLRFYLFIFRERGRGGEREGEKHLVASCAPPTGDPACNPGMCSDWESNQ